MTFSCGACHGCFVMERDNTGGGALEPTVDLTLEDLDEWDLSFARLRNAGLDEQSERTESYRCFQN